MIFVSFDELRSHLDLENLNGGIMKEAFILLRNDEYHHHLFTNIDEYKEKSFEYILSQGWDPDTTLVLFDPPTTEEEKIEKEINKQVAEDLDWENFQVGEVNPKQVICSFYKNLTLQKMAQIINSMAKMKAFL